jgi:hypothetical protein
MRHMPVGRYRHFKGNEYEVIGVARHSETEEDLVVYRPLYGSYRLMVRPAGMFQEVVTRDGKTQPRFAYIGPLLPRKLAPDSFARARAFLLEHARPLEQALYRYFFEAGALDDVYGALSAHQNGDGGFGHGLEPDLQSAHSSALATTTALQILCDVDAPLDHPLWTGALDYLLATYDPARQCWPIIPPAANDAPHAPWWTVDGQLGDRFGGYLLNPRAEILGYLYQQSTRVPPGFLENVTKSVLAHLAAQPDALEQHDLLCCVRLAARPGLPEAVRQELMLRLERSIACTVAVDPHMWTQYTLQPLAVAPSPGALFAGQLADALQANLDALITLQGDDGAWSPTWSWFGAFADAWPAAEQAWKGVLTLAALRQLNGFGRLAV